jgi:hypothetical protein
MRRTVAVLFATLTAFALVACATQPSSYSEPESTTIQTDSQSLAPTPIPTVAVPDLASQAGDTAQATLIAAGFLVVAKAANGETVMDLAGWTVTGQSVPAGGSASKGSTISLTVEQPAPPPPPAPAPAAPAPAAPAPAAPAPVAPGGGATALCNDGSLSFAAHHQGACSHHGGVAQWYK